MVLFLHAPSHLERSCDAWGYRSHLVAIWGPASTLKTAEQPDSKNRREVDPHSIMEPLHHPRTASLWTPCNVRELKPLLLMVLLVLLLFVPERIPPPSYLFSGFPNSFCYTEDNLCISPRIMSGSQ